ALGFEQAGGEGRHPHRLPEARPQIEQRAVMVFMGVGDDDADDIVDHALDEARVGQDEIDTGQIGVREGDADIDDQPFARRRRAEAVEGEVHADLADPAQRAEDKLLRVRPGHVFFLSQAEATAPKGTSPAATVTQAPSCLRMTKRHSSSMVAKMPRTTSPSMRTATSLPSPAAFSSQRA